MTESIYGIAQNARAVPPHIKETLRARLAIVEAKIDTLSTELTPLRTEAKRLKALLEKPDTIDDGLATKGGKPSKFAVALDILKDYPEGLTIMDLSRRSGWGYQNASLVLRECVAKDLAYRAARGLYFARTAALARLEEERAATPAMEAALAQAARGAAKQASAEVAPPSTELQLGATALPTLGAVLDKLTRKAK